MGPSFWLNASQSKHLFLELFSEKNFSLRKNPKSFEPAKKKLGPFLTFSSVQEKLLSSTFFVLALGLSLARVRPRLSPLAARVGDWLGVARRTTVLADVGVADDRWNVFGAVFKTRVFFSSELFDGGDELAALGFDRLLQL